MPPPKIHFIITGGTIDSYYEGTLDTVKPHKKSVLPEFIESLKPYFKPKFTTVCMKDSRELTKKDLLKILKAIEKSPAKRIIITHGTYTMPDTARYLENNLKRKDQAIILTGSMIPLDGFNLNDAGFNLGYAIAKTSELKAGIYIAMNSKIFNSKESTKIIQEGRFISLFSK
ncbi:MAG: asparaginase domain-containing protein [Candidatus Diapherotrites archaeon]